jgi:hypothetical protein
MLIKVFFCLLISYLQIKSYIVFIYNNCSTDCPFPLSVKIVLTLRVSKKKRWTMHWHFSLKIREQFTVSAFSLTIWKTLLHILINVYWNKSGLIQTDATTDIVVNSFLAWLITESITIHSVHLPFQSSKVYRLHINT